MYNARFSLDCSASSNVHKYVIAKMLNPKQFSHFFSIQFYLLFTLVDVDFFVSRQPRGDCYRNNGFMDLLAQLEHVQNTHL
jgi:hypothetical protein